MLTMMVMSIYDYDVDDDEDEKEDDGTLQSNYLTSNISMVLVPQYIYHGFNVLVMCHLGDAAVGYDIQQCHAILMQ